MDFTIHFSQYEAGYFKRSMPEETRLCDMKPSGMYVFNMKHLHLISDFSSHCLCQRWWICLVCTCCMTWGNNINPSIVHLLHDFGKNINPSISFYSFSIDTNRICHDICQHRTMSTLAQVMACCLMAPSHYLNQCGLIINESLWQPA